MQAKLVIGVLACARAPKFLARYVAGVNQAVQALERGSVDVVVLDAGQGLDDLQAIRAAAPAAAVVLRLARADEDLIFDALEAGAHSCLVKDASAAGAERLMRAIRLAHERKQAELSAALVDRCEDAVVRLALDGTITGWNSAATALYGYTGDETLGDHFSLVCVDSGQRLGFEQTFSRIAGGERVHPFEAALRRKGGRTVDVWLAVSPVLDADGRTAAIAVVGRDVTDRKRLELARERTLRELGDAQRLPGAGSWYDTPCTPTANIA